ASRVPWSHEPPSRAAPGGTPSPARPSAESRVSPVSCDEHLEREKGLYEDGVARLPDEADARQRQLTRMGNAAGGAGLALLMAGRVDEASEWFHRAAERYRESIAGAPAGSWGRPIGAMKALVLAGDWGGAEAAASWALDPG